MESVIFVLWLVGTGYAVFNIVRPTRPLAKRWHGVAALFGVSILCSALAAPFAPKGAGVEVSQPPQNAATQAEPSKDVQLVRVDPNAPTPAPSVSVADDARMARQEMKEQLRLIDAAEAVLASGMNAGNRDAVEMVRRDMQRLDVKLIQRRPALGSDRWPEDADEGFGACEEAAQRLSVFAASALQEQSLEEVAARQKFEKDYAASHKKCEEWVG